MSAVHFMLWGQLLAGPANAESTTVYRAPIATRGEFTPAELEALRSCVDDEFARTKFVSILPSDPGVCATPDCWRSNALAAGSRYIASLEIDAAHADQHLNLFIVDLEDGATVVAVERTCELCGRDELLDATRDLAATGLRKLQSHAAVTTALSVDSTPRGARVFVDGDEVGVTPIRIDVAAGPHTVELSADGYESLTEAFDLERGTTQSVRIRLSAEPEPLAAPQAPPASAPTRRRGRLVLGTALAGAGLAGAVTGVALLMVHGRPITPECSGENVDADGDCHFLRNTRTGGVISLSAGATALIGGAVLVGLELRRDRPGNLALAATPAGLRLCGRF